MNGGRPAQAELLVVVEPATDPAAPGADALAAEAVRLAGALEAGLACVTWPAEPPAALEQVADALAGLVQATQPAAVLLLDTDAGRQLAPMVAQRCGSGAVTGCSDVVVRERPTSRAAIRPGAHSPSSSPCSGDGCSGRSTPWPAALRSRRST